MAYRTPSPKSRTGEQKNQFVVRTGYASVIGSKVVDPKLTTRRKNAGGGAASYTTGPSYEIIGVHFEDVGGASAELAQRVSALKNSDGTFTIYNEYLTGTGPIAWGPSITTAVRVRWTILVTG